MKNNFIFLKFKLLFAKLLYQKDYFLSKISKPLFLRECDYETLFLNYCKKPLDKDFFYKRISQLLAYTVLGLNDYTLDENEKYHAQEIKNISVKTLNILRYKIIKALGTAKLYDLSCSQIIWMESLTLKCLQKRDFLIEKITKEEIIGCYEMTVDHLESF